MSEEASESGWVSARIRDVAHINPRVDKSVFNENDELPFVPMPAVEAETGKIDVSKRRPFIEVKSGFTPFSSGDVLFAKITPCMENGKVAVVPPLDHEAGFGSTEFHVLRPNDALDKKFLYFFVSSAAFRHEAQHNMAGAVGQKRVPKVFIENKIIPLPPLNEQRRIVEKIETLFARLDKGEEAVREVQKLLTRYRQSVLKAAVTGELTADWRAETGAPEWLDTSLGDLTEFLTSGSRGWAKYYAETGDKFIRAQNLKYDRLDLDDIAFVSLPEKSEGKRTRVRKGDILITITGANVTRAALVSEDIETAYVSQHVALFRPTNKVLPEFFHWFVVTEAAGRKQLEDFAYGAGKPGLNLTNIREVKLRLPGLEEQGKIVDRLREAFSMHREVEAAVLTQLKRSASLRQSILKDAFAGRLVPQDPSDEPASALLARITAEKKPARRTRRKTPA